MRTVRRLFVVHLVPCMLAVALSVAPAAAQGDLQRWNSADQLLQPMHPILGTITDDPGPFSRVVWGSLATQLYLPQEETAEASVVGDPPKVLFNPVSGYPIAVWTSGGAVNGGQDGGDEGGIRGYDVLFSHFKIGGWDGPTLMAEGAADPSLLIDPSDGGVHLVYWTPNDGGGVWHRQAPADLTSWTDPVRVSDGREAAARPTAMFHGDKLSIAYESHMMGLGSTPRQIVMAQREEQGYSRTVLAMTSYQGRNWVRLDSDAGRSLLVRWVSAEQQAGWTLQGEDGNWGPVEILPLVSQRLGTTEGGRRVGARRSTAEE